MAVNWYPGHMKKAQDQIKKLLPLVDLTLEILDSRLPRSSANQAMEEITKNKPRLVLLNKKDMASPETTDLWVRYFRSKGMEALAVDGQRENFGPALRKRALLLLEEKRAKESAKGMRERDIRMMVFGIPNSGKSTVVNNLAQQKKAKVENKPGVTRSNQWIKSPWGIVLLDTPGILMTRLSEEQGLHLAWTGAIKDQILDLQDLSFAFLEWIKKAYPESLENRYGVRADQPTLHLMDEIGRAIGAVQRGGEIDYGRTSQRILDDFRKLRLGRISLEEPDTK